jgi:1-acyl-sn-glycerol-3-phosphate acyltransferase
MIYAFGKYLLRLGAEFFFSKHHIKSFENLRTNKPLIVCANHASAHLDGILIMIFSRRRFHVLVRADVFKKKWVSKLLAKINLIPIYRIRDGFNNLEKNSETFDQCYEILKNNGAIIIFPEANCEAERKLRKLHKGAAKIAMMAEERSGFTLGVEMATVGITQEKITSSGGRIFLEASKPFSLEPYVKSYHQHTNKAYTEIIDDVETDLKTVLPVVNNTDDEFLFEYLVSRKNTIDDLDAWKKTASLINQTDPELKKAFSAAIYDFNKHLKSKGIDLATVEKLHKVPRAKRWLSMLVPLIDIAALFPFFIIGFVFNYFQFYVPQILTRKLFKDVCFINGTHFAMATFIFFFSYLFYILVLSFYVSFISVVIGILVIGICGIVSYYYRKRFMQLLKSIRFEMAGEKLRKQWISQYRVISIELAEWQQN